MYDGFAVLVGHLVGDFILQNDRTARFKGYPWPDRNACPDETATWWVATGMCVWHCLLYTVVIAAFAGWLTWWGAAACFAAHFVIDRFRLAGKWMRTPLAGQADFAAGPYAAWSVVLVDQVFHLLTLYLLAVAHGVTRFGG